MATQLPRRHKFKSFNSRLALMVGSTFIAGPVLGAEVTPLPRQASAQISMGVSSDFANGFLGLGPAVGLTPNPQASVLDQNGGTARESPSRTLSEASSPPPLSSQEVPLNDALKKRMIVASKFLVEKLGYRIVTQNLPKEDQALGRMHLTLRTFKDKSHDAILSFDALPESLRQPHATRDLANHIPVVDSDDAFSLSPEETLSILNAMGNVSLPGATGTNAAVAQVPGEGGSPGVEPALLNEALLQKGISQELGGQNLNSLSPNSEAEVIPDSPMVHGHGG